MLRSAIYWTVREQSVVIVYVLDVGEIGRHKNLRDCDKCQIVMASISQAAGLKRYSRSKGGEKALTNAKVWSAHFSVAHKGNKDCFV